MRMYNNKRMIAYIIMLVAAILLILAASFEVIDAFWSGFGGGIAGVAIVRMILGMKYRRDPEYAKKVDINNSDERSIYISAKAKSFAFYLTIVLLAVVGMVLIIVGIPEYGKICMYILCAMALIYWVAYIILDKKY